MSDFWILPTVVFSCIIVTMFTILFVHHYQKLKFEEKGLYRKTIKCQNCEHINFFEIKKGTCLKDFLFDKRCPKCECVLHMDGSVPQRDKP